MTNQEKKDAKTSRQQKGQMMPNIWSRRLIRDIVLALTFLACGAGVSGLRAAELIISQGVDPIGFDPARFATGNHVFLHQLYDTLITLDAQGNPQPALAESWQRSSDGLTVTFRLREARFHTGRSITADDVVFTIERYKTERVGANLLPRMRTITAARAIDPRTVRFTLTDLTPGLFDLLGAVFIQNRDVVDGMNRMDAGSGPYLLREWRPGVQFVMERFAQHWRNDRTMLDRITVRIIPDEAAAAAALQTGGVDLVLQSGAIAEQQLRGVAGIRIERPQSSPRSYYLMLNTSRPPLNNQLVRQVISRAIDRKRIAEIVYRNHGTATCQPWSASHWAHTPALENTCAFNPDEARRLLRSSGVAPFSISVNTAVDAYSPGSVETAQILKEDLAKIGITLEIRTFDQARARTLLLASDFDMLLHVYTEGGNDPQLVVPSGFYGPGGRAKYSTPEYVALVASAGQTIDISERRKIYGRIASSVIDAAFIMPIVHEFPSYPMRQPLAGFRVDNSGFPILWGVTGGRK